MSYKRRGKEEVWTPRDQSPELELTDEEKSNEEMIARLEVIYDRMNALKIILEQAKILDECIKDAQKQLDEGKGDKAVLMHQIQLNKKDWKYRTPEQIADMEAKDKEARAFLIQACIWYKHLVCEAGGMRLLNFLKTEKVKEFEDVPIHKKSRASF